VKYHLGASSDRSFDGNNVHLSLTANPSHLESSIPSCWARCAPSRTSTAARPASARPCCAAHPGVRRSLVRVVVAECFGLSASRATDGGSIHFIINNQIASPPTRASRAPRPTASDVAKMVEAPIFHVNGDNPEGRRARGQDRYEFRQKFRAGGDRHVLLPQARPQ